MSTGSNLSSYFHFIFFIFNLKNSYCYFIFWLCFMEHRILGPHPGIEPTPPALELQSLNLCTTTEVPLFISFVSPISSHVFGPISSILALFSVPSSFKMVVALDFPTSRFKFVK